MHYSLCSYLKKVAALALAFFLFFSAIVVAQEHSTNSTQDPEIHEFRNFRMSVVLYHTYIGTKTSDGKKMLIVPSVGLDLEYWFNQKWGIGSHNDLELVNFEVEEIGGTFIERETPVLFTLNALWKPWYFVFLLDGRVV